MAARRRLVARIEAALAPVQHLDDTEALALAGIYGQTQHVARHEAGAAVGLGVEARIEPHIGQVDGALPGEAGAGQPGAFVKIDDAAGEALGHRCPELTAGRVVEVERAAFGAEDLGRTGGDDSEQADASQERGLTLSRPRG